MSYHHWSNARDAGRRPYEGHSNRSNITRFNHANFPHQQDYYNYGHGMRHQQTFFNEEEGQVGENNDSCNETSYEYIESHRNGSENENNKNGNNVGHNGASNSNAYRNCFTRHQVAQESAFRGNLQLWHTRIFTRSDRNSSNPYTIPQFVPKHCEDENNRRGLEHHSKEYLCSDIAGNTFSRKEFDENGESHESELYEDKLSGGYIAPNVGYIGMPRFRSPMNFDSNYSYPTHSSYCGTSTPPENNESIRDSDDIPIENFTRLEDFPSLSSTIRKRNTNSSNGNSIYKKNKAPKSENIKSHIEGKTEHTNAKAQDIIKMLNQNEQDNCLHQEQEEEHDIHELQRQMQDVEFHQAYQQQQLEEHNYLEPTQSSAKKLQKYHEQHLPYKKQKQNHMQLSTEAHPNTNILKIFSDVGSKQHKIKQKDCHIMQQQPFHEQRQQLSYLQYHKRTKSHELHLDNQQLLSSPRQNYERQQNGEQRSISHVPNGQQNGLKDLTSQKTYPRWNTSKLPPQQYSEMLKRNNDNHSQKGNDEISLKLCQLQENKPTSAEFSSSSSKHREECSRSNKNVAPTLSGSAKCKAYQRQNHSLDFQFRLKLKMLDKSQQTEEKGFGSNCKSPSASDGKIVPEILQYEDTEQHASKDRKLSLEHFPALPKRSQLTQVHESQLARNTPISQGYIQYPQAVIREQQKHMRDTFSSILISSQNQNASTDTMELPKTPIFKMRMEDFPALPSMKSRISKNINSITNGGDHTQTATEMNASPNETSSGQPQKTIVPSDVNAFLPNLEKKCTTDKKFVKTNGVYTPPKTTLAVWPNDRITNIPTSMLTDQYGIAGLYSAYKAADTDPHIARMTFGIELETLGLDLRSKQPLLPRFKGPFSCECEEPYDSSNDFLLFPKKHQNQQIDESDKTNQSNANDKHLRNFTLGPNVRDSLAQPVMDILSDEDLFYIFYTFVQDLLQLQAANELYNRAWVFYIKDKIWITHDPERSYQQNGQIERGYYICYDHEVSKCVLKFMKIDTDQIDNRPTIPPIYRDNSSTSSTWSSF